MIVFRDLIAELAGDDVLGLVVYKRGEEYILELRRFERSGEEHNVFGATTSKRNLRKVLGIAITTFVPDFRDQEVEEIAQIITGDYLVATR